MNELRSFTFNEQQQIRTTEKDGEVWFFASDVCAVLEIGNITDAMARLDQDEKSTFDSIEGGLPRHIISESGLYSLVLGSRKPKAKEFKRWVTHEVIPAIHKTGSYSAVKPTQSGLLSAAFVGLAQVAAQLETHETQLAAHTTALAAIETHLSRGFRSERKDTHTESTPEEGGALISTVLYDTAADKILHSLDPDNLVIPSPAALARKYGCSKGHANDIIKIAKVGLLPAYLKYSLTWSDLYYKVASHPEHLREAALKALLRGKGLQA